MDLHYYHGDCTKPEAKSQIKQKFIQLLNETFFKEVCHSELKDKCKAENLKVTCSRIDFVPSERKQSGGMEKGYKTSRFKIQETFLVECFHSSFLFFFQTFISVCIITSYTQKMLFFISFRQRYEENKLHSFCSRQQLVQVLLFYRVTEVQLRRALSFIVLSNRS